MLLFMDGFDHYGAGAVGIANMLDGPYASVAGEGPVVPSWGPARTGQFCFEQGDTGGGIRRALPTPISTVLVGMGYAVDNLPFSNGITGPITWSNDNNETVARLMLQSTGVLALVDTNGAVVVQTSTPVVVAQNWHFIECEITTTSGSGAFRLDIDGATVINVSGLTFPAPASPDASLVVAQLTWGLKNGAGASVQYFDDLTVRNTSGTYNNSFQGDFRVATLFPASDGPHQGWTPQYRQKIGTGIMQSVWTDPDANGHGYFAPASTSLDLGTGDFTFETFVRFAVLPSGAEKAVIFGKWDETHNTRSYQLYLGGPTLESGNLVFRTSTDGTAGTVVEEISYPWAPDTDTWYNICVVRASGEDLLFINGVQLGLPIADARSYFVGGASFSVAGQSNGGGTFGVGDSFNGWMDETRFTVGFARYTSSYAVSNVAFPRNVGGDPHFAQVALLAGYDSGLFDEFSFARVLTGVNGCTTITPSDGSGAYQVINNPTPQDDTFVEAPLLPAQNVLTLAAQPTAADTVTVGTKIGAAAAVYKFVAALTGAAFEVLIDTSVPNTLQNLANAINAGPGSGTKYGTGTTSNIDVEASGLPGDQMEVIANVPGTSGNSIASTSALTNGSSGWASATLTGGAGIPGISDFYFQRPPLDTTLIAAVEIVTRAFKSDSSAASMQVGFVGPLGTVDEGANNALTISPTYRQDVFETDPDTGVQITPSTIVGGKVQLNRTA